MMRRLAAIWLWSGCSPVPHAPGCVDLGYGLPDPTATEVETQGDDRSENTLPGELDAGEPSG
jgi:hypothetical protein